MRKHGKRRVADANTDLLRKTCREEQGATKTAEFQQIQFPQRGIAPQPRKRRPARRICWMRGADFSRNPLKLNGLGKDLLVIGLPKKAALVWSPVSYRRTGQPFIVAGSGTLTWDMTAANLVEPGEDVLVVNTGVFGDWFGE
ncbi:hypothetical protein BDK51DRAFT_31818, partial [Blyttiomyces helicus]